jgi:hypothetical protein
MACRYHVDRPWRPRKTRAIYGQVRILLRSFACTRRSAYSVIRRTHRTRKSTSIDCIRRLSFSLSMHAASLSVPMRFIRVATLWIAWISMPACPLSVLKTAGSLLAKHHLANQDGGASEKAVDNRSCHVAMSERDASLVSTGCASTRCDRRSAPCVKTSARHDESLNAAGATWRQAGPACAQP